MSTPAPPQAIESERLVLGSMLTVPGAIERAAELLSPAHFYRAAHGKVFAAMTDLARAGTPVDLVSLANHLRSLDQLDAAGGYEALAELAEHSCALANVAHHASVIADRMLAREVLSTAISVQEAAYDATVPASKLVADASALMSQVAERGRRTGLSAAARWTERLSPEALVRPEPLLAGGVLSAADLGLIAGDGGLGKSRIAIELAAAMACGDEWLGLPTVAAPARVGYLAAEFTRYRWVERLVSLFTGERPRDPDELLAAFRSLHLSSGDGAFVSIPGEELDGPLNLLEAQAGEQLIALIRERALDVCFLDCLSRLMGGADETNEFFGQLLVTLDRVRFKTGCALVLIHHARKSAPGTRKGDEDPMDLVRGGTKLRDGINTGLFLSQLEGGLLKLTCFKANYGRKPDPAYLRIPEGGGRTLVEMPPDERRDVNAKRILDWLTARAGERFTSEEITSGVGELAIRTCRRHLKDLNEQGRIYVQSGPNKSVHYMVPESIAATRPVAASYNVAASDLLGGLEDMER